MKRCYAVLCCLLLSACSHTLSVSESELSHYINDHVSYQHEDGIPGLLYLKAELGQVKVKLGRAQADTMEVVAHSKIELQNPIQPFSGEVTVYFSAVPWYHAATGALYLKQVQLTKIESEPRELANDANKVLPQISQTVRAFLETQPVYVLDESKAKEAQIKAVGKEIVIKPGKIEFVAELL
ncbi:DUF1439 domain-containing protein [Motilimonas pumila]|uniref:DUF1439 domain-containing protein n=1 Tax=Motilimonas pumila TaxID=2303987 RepID=A0A418YHR9_9GAMM|nr:DUF1439 domain-containing protein [Motilimonas pumila]RJG49940.1 DUF1439 domain-containing protein [Motilimonas pumila]